MALPNVAEATSESQHQPGSPCHGAVWRVVVGVFGDRKGPDAHVEVDMGSSVLLCPLSCGVPAKPFTQPLPTQYSAPCACQPGFCDGSMG